MDNSGSARISGIQRPHVIQEGIDKGSRTDSCADVTYQTGRFIDHGQGVVLVQNVQRDFFRMGIAFWNSRNQKSYMIVQPGMIAGFCFFSIDLNVSFADPVL